MQLPRGGLCIIAAASGLLSPALGATLPIIPIRLRISGKHDRNIDGYVSTCVGQRRELALCNTTSSDPVAIGGYFYFNSFDSSEPQNLTKGLMTFNEEPFNKDWGGNDPRDPDAIKWVNDTKLLKLRWNTRGSAAVAGLDNIQWIVDDVGFDVDGKLQMYGVDDSAFSVGMRPGDIPRGLSPSQNWYLCYTIMPGMWDGYDALLGSGEMRWLLTWAPNVAPTNPTCQAVDVTMEQLEFAHPGKSVERTPGQSIEL
ncbi:hypothetical protein DL769_009818 [Monosporascus sp. CRB-8-3]|nr:hypothetical protein DL769_009818 [Monosporascus sp. CRB-8-3]